MLRWPTSVTAKSFSPRQNHFRYGKIIFATAKSFSPRQNHFRHGKIIFATAKSFSPRQNHFRHGKIIFATAKSFSPSQNNFSLFNGSLQCVMRTYPTRQAKTFREVLLVFSQSDDVLRQLKSDGFQLSEFLRPVWTS